MFYIKGVNYETGSTYERQVKAYSIVVAQFLAAELQIELGSQWHFTAEEL